MMVLYNRDLLEKIFVSLPAKSLIRLKSVCKKWRDVISSDHFCKQHALRWQLQSSLILQIHMYKWIDGERQNRTMLFYLNSTVEDANTMVRYALPRAVAEYKILDACNGLWLIESIRGQTSRFACYGPGHEKDRLYVYNPTTRASREITLPYSAEYPYLAEINLAFDPSSSPNYKIVCLWSTGNNSSSGSYQIHVYYSEIQTWNLRVEKLESSRISYGVYWNNAIYWSLDDVDKRSYICFDMCRNEIASLSFPQNGGACRNCNLELQGSNGNLYHVEAHTEEYDESETVQVWKLIEESEWEIKHSERFGEYGIGEYGIVRYIAEESALLIYRKEKIKSLSFRDEGGEDLIDDEGGEDLIDDEGEDFMDDEEEDLFDDEQGEDHIVAEDFIELTSQSFYERDLVIDKVIGFIFGETLALV